MSEKKFQTFQTRMIPIHVEEESTREKPFVVAFDRGGQYTAGDRLTTDEFQDVIQSYDAAIIHRKKGDHPSQPNRFLLYGAAKHAVDAETHIEMVTEREQSIEVTGPVRWFRHGKELSVDATIGLHCLREDTWNTLP